MRIIVSDFEQLGFEQPSGTDYVREPRFHSKIKFFFPNIQFISKLSPNDVQHFYGFKTLEHLYQQKSLGLYFNALAVIEYQEISWELSTLVTTCHLSNSSSYWPIRVLIRYIIDLIVNSFPLPNIATVLTTYSTQDGGLMSLISDCAVVFFSSSQINWIKQKTTLIYPLR